MNASKEKPKVSIIIPTFNASKHIVETLHSVYDQTVEDYEILLVDDGSIDNTLEILEEEAKTNKRIRVFSKSNGGPGSARNIGLKEAVGKYIAFLDSDDLWSKSKIEAQLKYMESDESIGFSYTDAECFVDLEGKRQHVRDFICDVHGHVFVSLFWSNFIVNSTVVMRRECIGTVGFQDTSQSLLGAEDYDYWLRLSRVFKLGNVSQKLTNYRLRDESVLGDSYDMAFPKHVEIYKKFYKNYDDTKEIVGMSFKEAVVDLCLRYAYKNFVESSYIQMLKKILLAGRYDIKKSIRVTRLFLTKDGNLENELSNFSLWSKIVGNATK